MTLDLLTVFSILAGLALVAVVAVPRTNNGIALDVATFVRETRDADAAYRAVVGTLPARLKAAYAELETRTGFELRHLRKINPDLVAELEARERAAYMEGIDAGRAYAIRASSEAVRAAITEAKRRAMQPPSVRERLRLYSGTTVRSDDTREGSGNVLLAELLDLQARERYRREHARTRPSRLLAEFERELVAPSDSIGSFAAWLEDEMSNGWRRGRVIPSSDAEEVVTAQRLVKRVQQIAAARIPQDVIDAEALWGRMRSIAARLELARTSGQIRSEDMDAFALLGAATPEALPAAEGASA